MSAQPFFDRSTPDLPPDEPTEPDLPVHVDPAAMLRDSLAAAIGRPGHRTESGNGGDGSAVSRHGAGDDRQAARRNSERARSGRAAGAGGGRSYAFRRS